MFLTTFIAQKKYRNSNLWITMKPVIYLFLICLFNFINGQIQFTDITNVSGLGYNISGEGVCVFDYDNDGLEDIFICDNNNGSNLLFHNLGNMQFEEVSYAVGIYTSSSTRLPIAGDYNNDSYLDLFLGALNGNSFLYENNGDGSFSDVTAQSGIVTNGGIRGGAWHDVNNDGWIDLYVGRLTEYNYFFKNNGDGTFTDIAQNINADGPQNGGLVMGLSFVDYDNDGDEDLFITQDNNMGNILLRKQNSGSFIDVSASAGVDLPVMGMGVAVGDYDRDGWLDIYTSNLYQNSLLRNSPQGYFNDVADSAGVEDIPGSMAWGTFFFDADNDGWVDLFNNNESGFGNIPNSFFRNLGDGTFEDLSEASGLQSYNNGIGCAFGDLDNDGDLDIVAAGHSSVEGSILLYRNDSSINNWVQFDLRTNGLSPFAIGAKVELYTQSGIQLNVVTAGNGYCSQNTFIQHFGLGIDISIDSVVVNWPDTEREMFIIPAINQRYLLNKGTGNAVQLSVKHTVIPKEHKIINIYPNPFNLATTILLQIVDLHEDQYRVRIYDVRGKLVETLLNEPLGPGKNELVWNAYQIPSGVYFIQLETPYSVDARKSILLK